MGFKKGYLSNNRKEDREIDRVRKKRQQTVKGGMGQERPGPLGLEEKSSLRKIRSDKVKQSMMGYHSVCVVFLCGTLI